MIVSDGAGGAIIVWQDSRGGTSNVDVYAQRVSAAGAVLWAANGVALCTATGNQVKPRIIPDGAGGAIVTWQDQRSAYSDIYAQRISAVGSLLWPANGVVVCSATYSQVSPSIASDGSAGAIITWEDYRVAGCDIYAQRVSAAGMIQWPMDGVALCMAPSSQVAPAITSDGAGGAVVTWQDTYRFNNDDIYAQRVATDGTTQWQVNGVAVCTYSDEQLEPKIVSDGTGGAIITWKDWRVYNDFSIYAQRVSANGTLQWAAEGLPLCTDYGDQNGPNIVTDDVGGAIVAWYDNRSGISGEYDIYAQRVSAAGMIQWPTNGTAVCPAPGYQGAAALVADGVGGTIVTWRDFRSGNNDIYVQRISAIGMAQWATNGVALCTATGQQMDPAIASDGNGGAIAAWLDYRHGSSNIDIYAQRIQGNGQLGGDVTAVSGGPEMALVLDPVCPNPASTSSRLSVCFRLAGGAPAWLELFDISGRRISTREVGGLGLGRHALTLAEDCRLAPGVYFVRLRQGAETKATRVAVLD